MSCEAAMTNKPKITYRTRRELPPARIRRHWPGGIFWRELCAALPTVAALAGLVGLVVLANLVLLYFRRVEGQAAWFPDYLRPGDAWIVIALIAFFLTGVLSGGEEAENGTADFARRLPVSRPRIYAAKTTGALSGVAFWFGLSVLLANLIVMLAARFHGPDVKTLMINPFHDPAHSLLPVMANGLLLFFCGQAAAAWVERVIVGALVGGAFAIVWIFSTYLSFSPVFHWTSRNFGSGHVILLMIGCALAFAAALIRFLTREGR